MAGGAQAGGGGSCSHARGHSGRLNWNLNAGHCCPQNGQESALPRVLGQAGQEQWPTEQAGPFSPVGLSPSLLLHAALLDLSSPLYSHCSSGSVFPGGQDSRTAGCATGLEPDCGLYFTWGASPTTCCLPDWPGQAPLGSVALTLPGFPAQGVGGPGRRVQRLRATLSRLAAGFCAPSSLVVVAEEAGVGAGLTSEQSGNECSPQSPAGQRLGAQSRVPRVLDSQSGGPKIRESTGLPPWKVARRGPQILPAYHRAQLCQEGHSSGLRAVSGSKLGPQEGQGCQLACWDTQGTTCKSTPHHLGLGPPILSFQEHPSCDTGHTRLQARLAPSLWGSPLCGTPLTPRADTCKPSQTQLKTPVLGGHVPRYLWPSFLSPAWAPSEGWAS